MLTCCEVFMRRQLIVSMACAFSFVLSSMASTMPTLPEFRSQQQLAQWRETAAKAAPQSVAAKSTGPAFFTGKPYDAASGNYVFKYRNYNPCLARWTSTDPSGFPDGANNSAYVANNPLGLLDDTGLAQVVVRFWKIITEEFSATFANSTTTAPGYTAHNNFNNTILDSLTAPVGSANFSVVVQSLAVTFGNDNVWQSWTFVSRSADAHATTTAYRRLSPQMNTYIGTFTLRVDWTQTYQE